MLINMLTNMQTNTANLMASHLVWLLHWEVEEAIEPIHHRVAMRDSNQPMATTEEQDPKSRITNTSSLKMTKLAS